MAASELCGRRNTMQSDSGMAAYIQDCWYLNGGAVLEDKTRRLDALFVSGRVPHYNSYKGRGNNDS